jgi:hypothetical protein
VLAPARPDHQKLHAATSPLSNPVWRNTVARAQHP